MPRRVLLAAASMLLVAGAIFAAPPEGLIRIPGAADARQAQAEVNTLLDRGRQLERDQRWGEALNHYENALRDFPEERQLRERHDLARIRYDLGRRYHDHSFRAAARTLNQREAIALYGDVLLKIEAHYVDRPDWRRLYRQGAIDLQAALSEKLFLDEHLADVGVQKVNEAIQRIEQVALARDVRTRHDVIDGADEIARLTQDALGLSPAAAILEFTCGATSSLDPYSSYLTGDQLRDVFAQIEGNFVGLGIEIKPVDGTLELVDVIVGSPAERSGLKAGERIVAIDERSIAAMNSEDAASLLQGKEGTVVRLAIVAADGRRRDVDVRRAQVEVPSVESVQILPNSQGVGYARITSFQKTTSRDLDAALWRLNQQQMRSLIIDLRGNPGGLLTASVEIADKFVSEGAIVSTRGRSSQEDFSYSAHRVGTWRVPLVVLIDGDSASASEILAGAIQDHRRGVIVGRRSYGKGSVQGIFALTPLAENVRCGVRLTTAKFYAPSGRPISHAGVTPEVEVRLTAKPADGAKAPQSLLDDADVAAAMAVAQNQVARQR